MRLSHFLAGMLIIAGQALPAAALATTLSPFGNQRHYPLPPTACDTLHGQVYTERAPCYPPLVDPRVVDRPSRTDWVDCCHTTIYRLPYYRPLPNGPTPQ